MQIRALLLCLSSVFSASSFAAMRSEAVSYVVGETEMSGVLVYDDASEQKRPGLLMVPNWYGVNDAQIEKAKAIAGSRYVIFIADVYGKTVRPSNNEEAGKAAGAMYQDRSVLRQRARAALDIFKSKAADAPLNADLVGAIGFCFGGATVLELARDGVALAGVASFHGNLSADPKWPSTSIRTPVLVMNGADDSYVPAAQIQAFTEEMQKAGADFQFVNFGGAVHCFAEPDANSPGCMYNERAAKRGFALMNAFFDEAFSKH